nr:MAG TPA: hypothetical protein [Inoviridae sp.]
MVHSFYLIFKVHNRTYLSYKHYYRTFKRYCQDLFVLLWYNLHYKQIRRVKFI